MSLLRLESVVFRFLFLLVGTFSGVVCWEIRY